MKYTSRMLQDVYKYNLCTYYLLPFCGVNVHTLGGYGNFVNCWLHPTENRLYVRILNMMMCEPNAFDNIFWIGNEGNIIGYRFPRKWDKVMEKFKLGRYSEFPLAAKEFLQKKSGLAYMYPAANTETGFVSDVRLTALDKDEDLRLLLQRELGCIIEKGSELMQPPGKESFMVI